MNTISHSHESEPTSQRRTAKPRRGAGYVLCALGLSAVFGWNAGMSPGAEGPRYAPMIPKSSSVTGDISGSIAELDGPGETDPDLTGGIGDQEFVPQLKGIIFTNHPDRVELITPARTGVHVGRNSTFAFVEWSDFVPTVEKYLNAPFSQKSLKKMEEDVRRVYRRHGISIVQLAVPQQDASGGTLQILLIEGRIAGVHVEGAQFFDSEKINSQLWASPGYYLDENDVREDTFWLSRNPFINVKPRIEPTEGGEPGDIDLYYDVKDRFPLMLTGGYMDTGTRGTQLERIFYGATTGNALGYGDILNYQFVASPDYQSLVSNSLTWVVPLPQQRNTLTMRGNYATLNPTESQDGLTWGAGFTFGRNLWTNVLDGEYGKDREKYRTAGTTCGFDFLHTNTNLDYGGTTVDQPVETAIFNAGFNWMQIEKNGVISFDVTGHFSPGGFSKYNSDHYFRKFSHRDARAEYMFVTAGLDMYRKFDGFDLRTKFFGQIAGGPLINYDQMGMGGIFSVRGYDSWTEMGDGGLNVNLELLTPKQSPARLDRLLGESPVWRDVAEDDTGNIQYFTFLDYALGVDSRRGMADGQKSTYSLAGTGVGMRYTYGPWVALNAAYGFQLLKPNDPAHAMTGRPHIILSISR